MKRSLKIGLVSAFAIAAIVGVLALTTHARESAEDSGNKLGAQENETALQALGETLQSNNQKSAQGETGENSATEAGEGPGQ